MLWNVVSLGIRISILLLLILWCHSLCGDMHMWHPYVKNSVILHELSVRICNHWLPLPSCLFSRHRSISLTAPGAIIDTQPRSYPGSHILPRRPFKCLKCQSKMAVEWIVESRRMTPGSEMFDSPLLSCPYSGNDSHWGRALRMERQMSFPSYHASYLHYGTDISALIPATHTHLCLPFVVLQASISHKRCCVMSLTLGLIAANASCVGECHHGSV